MLDQNRFLAMKNLAKDIRSRNEKSFRSFDNDEVDDAIREKDELIESIMNDMDIAFSDGDGGKEEKQIFRANLLIPDDLDFFTSYSKDKNIRNLMNKYAVGIEDIMSKITELNLYSKYIDAFNSQDSKEKESNDFVDNMLEISTKEEKPAAPLKEDNKLNLSAKEAESLLDEIEDLSNTMEELDIRKNDEPEEKNSISIEPQVVEELKPIEEDILGSAIETKPAENSKGVEIPFTFDEFKQMDSLNEPINYETIDFDDEKFENRNETENLDFDEIKIPEKIEIHDEIKVPDEIEESDEIVMADEIENIGTAVSEFVDEYAKVKKELEFTQAKAEKFVNEKEELKKQMTSLRDEKEKLERQNIDLREKLERATEELNKFENENKTLQKQVKEMEKTAKQSSDLLKEIYKSIPKKRFNVK